MKIRDKPLTLYYQIEVTQGQIIDVYPIYMAVATHSFGIFFHALFALGGSFIVDDYFSYSFTNPIRWFHQYTVEGSSLIGLMLIHGFPNVEAVMLVMIIYASIIALCYFQDQYLNINKQFNPDKEPQMFAIPIHILMILMIVGKASEHINDDKSLNIAIVTLISLGLTLVSYVLQRIHIKYQQPNLYSHDSTAVDVDDDKSVDGGDELESVVPTMKSIEHLDAVLDEMRRGIQYESYYYTNSVLFAMTVTWFTINITQSDQVLI